MKVSDEITGDCVGNRKTSSFSSNWTIASGSFDASVNFESSESPIDADGVDSVKKAPLLLKPSESDSSPCEITLSLMQKHEIRQVYVRSTARIYEIYYKPEVHSSNEYLCTVRCSIASREDASLHESNHGEGTIEPTKESDRDYKEKKSSSSANEDDWVEVKKPESPVEVINSMPKAIIGDERNLQDFYEATAEISDGEPSVTLIIRLLSLEKKGLVYVDEIYVYADAVESADLNNHAAQHLQGGALAGSSLMTMFLPTLLQMTRSNVGQSQNGLISNKVVEEEPAEGSRNIDSTNYSNEHYKRSKVEDRQDAEFQEVTEVTAPATPQLKNLAPNVENPGQYHSVVDCNNHFGRVMEQLNSRMSQIEDICLRFEEKMVRPISSMEERLQRVENQLETIVKNTQTSELHSCARFSAPAFSSLDSTSSSFYNDGCANPPHVQSEVEKHEPSCDTSKSTEENFKSGRAPQFIPSYVVTAPEFSCDEDDEQNDAVEPLKDFPSQIPKKPMSIDDALAAALAGFSSLTISEPEKLSEKFTKSLNEENGTNEDSVDRALEECIHRASNLHRDLLMKNPCTTYVDVEFINEETASEEHLKYTQGLKFTAPDFASEDTSYDVKVLTPGMEDVNLVHPSRTFATDRGENILDITSAPSNLSALEKEETITVRKTNVSERFCEGQTDADTFGGANNSVSVRSKCGYPATEETSNLSALEKEDTTIVRKTKVSEQLCEGQSDAYTFGLANNSVSVRAKGDYLATEETSLQESSSHKDELPPIEERLTILQQVLEKNNGGVRTKGKKCDERDEIAKHLLAKTKNSVGTVDEEHLTYTQGLKFTVPDFASEDTSYDVKVWTTGIEDVKLVHPSRTFATDGGEKLDITSAPSNLSALEKEETIIVHKTNVSEQFCEGQSDADTFGGANNSVSVRSKGGYSATEETRNLSALEKEETTIVRKTNVSEQFCEGQSDADTFGGANNSLSVGAKGDYPDKEETSLQESSSPKDEIPIWERPTILEQVHEKNNGGVGIKGNISRSISECDERIEILKQLLAKTKNSVGTAEKNSGPISICDEKQLLAKTKDTAEKISGPLLECNEGGSGNDISLGKVEDDYWATGEIGMLESSSSKDKLSISDRIKIIEQLGAKIKEGVGTKEKTSRAISKCDERGSGNDISSWLDFETPILEVKFTSQENTSSELSLKALLTNTEADSQISFTQRSKDDEITTKETDLGSLVNEEGNSTWESNNFLLVDLESYDAPVSSEDVAGRQVPLGMKEHEVLPSLI